MAARELRELSLMEALSLVVCYARVGSPCGLALAVDEVAVRVLIEPIEVAGVVGEDVTL
jgi:hypothetical protein